jgi:2-polyprenyl-3-methyl-5-hydroxy-6-metoxy-1,4-benzoquinol methylase
MSNFNNWIDVATKDLDAVASAIVTGKTVSMLASDSVLLSHCGSKDQPIHLLDFGCGIGRNTYAAASFSSQWNVVGYDSAAMISRVSDFAAERGWKHPENLRFTSNWRSLTEQKFDVVLASLVFQHIYETDLRTYLEDLKQMTKKVVINGRRFNDDNGKNTWAIMDSCGLRPVKILHPDPFTIDGPPDEHRAGIFEFQG